MLILVLLLFFFQVNGFMSVAACSAIVMTLCCISIDRYIAVNKPTKYRTLLTSRRAVYMILVAWFQALLYASFPVLGWSHYEYHPGTLHCSPAWTSNCSLYIFLSIAGFAIPLAAMFVTYIRIFQVIRKHSRRITTLKLGPASCQVNTVFSVTQEQDSQSPDVQNSSLDSPAANEENALQNGSSECPLTPSAIVTQEDGNVSRSLKLDDFLPPNDNQLSSPFEDLSQQILSPCDLFEEAQPSWSNSEPTVRKDQQSLPKKQSMRRVFQNLRSNLRSRKRDEAQLPREYKIAKTGLLLLVLYLILWLPYLVVNACTTNIQAPESVFHVAMWLVYMNGVANPVAYAFNNKRVKTKFRQIFHKIFGCFSRCR